MSLRIATTLLTLACLLPAVDAGADSQVAAPSRREAARRARLAYQSYLDGDYERAVRLYEAAYRLAPAPALLFNMALTWEKAFEYERCALAAQEFLGGETGADPAARSSAAELLGRCRTAARIPTKVSSWPPGAALYLGTGDDRTLAGRAPQSLDLAPGSYQLTAVMPGYRDETRTLEVTLGQRQAVDVVLEKLSALHIEADVSGARIQIDDGPWEAAPLTRELAAGSYRVKVARAGHRQVTRDLRVAPGEQVSLVVTLPPLPRRRLLTVTAAAGAQVSIDRAAELPAPQRRRLDSGLHHLEVTAPGHIPFATDIRLPEDGDLRLRVDLAERRTTTQRGIFWGLVGSAGVSLAAGGLLGAMALSDQADYRRGASPALRDRGEAHARAADMLLIGGAALAVTAVAYRWLTRPGSSRATAVSRPGATR